MELHPAELDDLTRIEVLGQTEDEREQVLNMLAGFTDQSVDVLRRCGRTLWRADGQVIACFGVWPMWPGVGRVWSLLSREVLSHHALTLHRHAKRSLDAIEERDCYLRLEAVIRQGHRAAHEWIEVLGFHHEGLMQNYGIGGLKNYHLYARTRACLSEQSD